MADAAKARWLSDELHALAARGPIAGRVIGMFGATLHADLAGFVAVVLPDGAPRMPNGLAIRSGLAGRPRPRPGATAVLLSDRLLVDGLAIEWDPHTVPRWDSRVPRRRAGSERLMRGRAEAILGDASRDPDGLAAAVQERIGSGSVRSPGMVEGLSALLASLRSPDRGAAASASRELIGRGPGLTPVGDDLVAAAALTVASLEDPSSHLDWLAALVPQDLRRRTTAVSATLLELAVRGRGVAPAHSLIDCEPIGSRRMAEHLDRIERLGHTTGAAYAAMIAAATLALPPANCKSNPEPQEVHI